MKNRKNSPYGRGGVIIFEEKEDKKFNLLWESEEVILHGEYSYFIDMNNDKISEIIVEDNSGASGGNTSYFVYAWQEGAFHLISPKDISSGVIDTQIGGDNAHTFIKDLDNDKIMEIIDGYVSDNDHLLHQRIYKFNKETGLYSLWKQTAEPVK